MAWRVVQHTHVHRLEGEVELTRLVQHPEVLTDVIGPRPNRLGSWDVEQATVVVLQLQPAGCRAGDDVDVCADCAPTPKVWVALGPGPAENGVHHTWRFRGLLHHR